MLLCCMLRAVFQVMFKVKSVNLETGLHEEPPEGYWRKVGAAWWRAQAFLVRRGAAAGRVARIDLQIVVATVVDGVISCLVGLIVGRQPRAFHAVR